MSAQRLRCEIIVSQISPRKLSEPHATRPKGLVNPYELRAYLDIEAEETRTKTNKILGRLLQASLPDLSLSNRLFSPINHNAVYTNPSCNCSLHCYCSFFNDCVCGWEVELSREERYRLWLRVERLKLSIVGIDGYKNPLSPRWEKAFSYNHKIKHPNSQILSYQKTFKLLSLSESNSYRNHAVFQCCYPRSYQPRSCSPIFGKEGMIHTYNPLFPNFNSNTEDIYLCHCQFLSNVLGTFKIALARLVVRDSPAADGSSTTLSARPGEW